MASACTHTRWAFAGLHGAAGSQEIRRLSCTYQSRVEALCTPCQQVGSCAGQPVSRRRAAQTYEGNSSSTHRNNRQMAPTCSSQANKSYRFKGLYQHSFCLYAGAATPVPMHQQDADMSGHMCASKHAHLQKSTRLLTTVRPIYLSRRPAPTAAKTHLKLDKHPARAKAATYLQLTLQPGTCPNECLSLTFLGFILVSATRSGRLLTFALGSFALACAARSSSDALACDAQHISSSRDMSAR